MDGGTLFRNRIEAITRVLMEMLEIRLHKNEVNGYAYNDANMLLTQIEHIIEGQLFEDSANRMKGLAGDVGNATNDYKSTVHIRKRDVLMASRLTTECASTYNITVKPETDNNINAQDKDDWQNVFRLAVIGIMEEIAEGITKIVRGDITIPILRTIDNSDLNLVGQYKIHQLFTAITEGAEWAESSNIRRLEGESRDKCRT